ncbi:MAG TPA: putative maltokinase, partial [Casimicrobiaceae bacterium]|nr:putative maltokinase [Casimicrobiaceae bacterium]
HEERLIRDELPVLVLFDGWASLFRDRVVPWRMGLAEKSRAQLERDVLPEFVAGRRWYAAKGDAVKRVTLIDHVEWQQGTQSWLMTIARVDAAAVEVQTAFLPLALVWEPDDDRLRALAPLVVAKVRQQAKIGVMADAFGDDAFCRALVAAIATGRELKTSRGKLQFRATAAFARLAGDAFDTLPVDPLAPQSSNTVVALGERLLLKAYRRLQSGVNPEAEIGRYLTDVAHFAHSVPVAGTIEHVADDGAVTTLALLQGYVQNQGDGWTTTLNYLEHFLEQAPPADAPATPAATLHGGYLALIRALGTRTGEMHAAFGHSRGNPAFDPTPVSASDLVAWTKRARAEANATLDRLQRSVETLPESARSDAATVLGAHNALLARIDAHAQDRNAGQRMRIHGDYHLGQVLVVQNDFVIGDFEGEPGRTLAERREKQSPAKDVAGMLRSFDYALHVAMRRASGDSTELHAERVRRGAEWLREVRAAFLESYDDAATRSGLAPVTAQRGLLDLFLLEKVLYELAYEMENRPDWVGIPLRGLVELLQSGD